ncbi:hypothetical protein CI102_4921 [Trichoderma harzianum]|nr:hypothetical protein CI102_4921 [Trichoderma harzianum]
MPLFRRACFVLHALALVVRIGLFAAWFFVFFVLLLFWGDVFPSFGCASREHGVVSKRPLSKALVCVFKQPSPSLASCFNSLRSIRSISKQMAQFYSFLLVHFLVLHLPCLPMYFVPPAELSRSGSAHQSEAHSTPCTLDLR